MKKRLVILCSWIMESTGKLPNFFTEQAKLISHDYDVTLVTVLPKDTKGIAALTQAPFTVTEDTTDEGLPLVKIYYKKNSGSLKRMNAGIRKKVLAELDRRFKFSSSKDVLIHANCMYDAGFWAYDINQAYGTPFVYMEHNQVTLREISKPRIDKTQKVLNAAKHNLMVSHDKARQILNLGFRFNFNVVGNYVDEQLFFPADRTGNTFRIITVGAYHHLKDPQTIFETIRLLDANNYGRDIEFIYAGFNRWGGDQSNNVKKKIEELSLKNIKVRLVPLATHSQIASLLKESNLFLFSSISEGMPVSVLEALATGLPVCTTQCGGVDELITDFNGKIIPLRNYQAMYEFAYKCIKDELKFDRNQIAKHVIAGYGREAFRTGLLQYYNTIQ